MMINNFLELTGSDKQLIIKTLLLMLRTRLILSLLPFKYTQKFSNKKITKETGELSVNKLIWAVESVSNYIPKATCLTKALTAHNLLNEYGYINQIKIGVGKDVKGEFEAHAWLEYSGEVILGESDKDFIPLLDL